MTVYLIRHASAGHRDNSDPDDVWRRLDAAGRIQAMRLATVLGHAGLTSVMSSPATRCVETVEPLATTQGLEVTERKEMLEGAAIEHSWDLVEKLAREGLPTALCSHGDIIPQLVARARGRGMAVPGKSGCAKGSIWTLHWEDDGFEWGTYTPIPL